MFENIRKERGELGCVQICTYGTISTKAAIKIAARGYRSNDCPDGIELDEAEYLSSLVPQERGFLYSLSDCFYGNQEKGRKPSQEFIKVVSSYPGLKEILLGIEGLIQNRSIHASGVGFYDNDNPYDEACFMKAKDGSIITQWSLHDQEYAGTTKVDILVTQQMDIMAQCITLLQEHDKIEPELTLRQAYDKYVSPDVLPMNDDKLWDAVDSTDILALFQLVSDVGSRTVKKLLPRDIETLNDCNGIMRLMADDSGETPTDRYVRLMNHPEQWDREMDSYGLTKEEQEVIKKYIRNGVLIDQETLMRIVMDKKICGFTLSESNSLRRCVAKKHMDEIPIQRQKILDRAISPAMGKYVWFLLQPSMGYSFSSIHGTSYSYIAVQAAYLATYFPSVYWNTAYLRVTSGLDEDSSTVYTKVSKAVGDIQHHNIKVLPVDINRSGYMFEPDEATNSIYYGMKSLTGIGGEAIQEIIENRPYTSIEDFESKVASANKTMIIALIKSGAFDQFGERKELMEQYLRRVSEPKKRITLQNFKGLVDLGLLPQELAFQKRLFVFNKALRAKKKVKDYYVINYNYYDFYEKFFDLDLLEPYEGTTVIPQKTWQKLYTKGMEPAKKYFQEHQQELLDAYNNILFQEQWDKYARGTYSTWEMDSLGYYYHSHELANVNLAAYGIIPYSSLTTEPKVEYTFRRDGREIPIYELSRIAGTVIGKNNTKATVDILTVESGVVTVKFNLEYFAKYNRRISDIINGENKVVESGWFSRGSILVLTGWRNGDIFRCRTRKKSPYPQLCKVTQINGQFIEMTDKRYGES